MTTGISLFITTNRVGTNNSQCNGLGDTYNPFNMTSMSSTCSLESPLSCEVGEISARQGPVSLTQGQVFTDSNIQLTGEVTVVHRSLVLKSGNSIIACANIVPESPSADQTFPNVANFSTYDFRMRVADVLQVNIAAVTILPGSPASAADGRCQQVSFMVSGEVSTELLGSVKTSEKMGVFKESDTCTRSAFSPLVQAGKGALRFHFLVPKSHISKAYPPDTAMSPKITGELLRQLRQAMRNCKYFSEPIQAYIIPSGDAHQ
ncbi:uncharacterized protein AKAME5_002512400, partial [Lates japonicus]